MKLIDIIYLLDGEYELIDNETDNRGATLVLERVAKRNCLKDYGKVVYESTFKLTDYGKRRFEKVLNSEILGISNVDCSAIMLDCEWEYIEDFLNACNGCSIGYNEYLKIFKESD